MKKLLIVLMSGFLLVGSQGCRAGWLDWLMDNMLPEVLGGRSEEVLENRDLYRWRYREEPPPGYTGLEDSENSRTEEEPGQGEYNPTGDEVRYQDHSEMVDDWKESEGMYQKAQAERKRLMEEEKNSLTQADIEEIKEFVRKGEREAVQEGVQLAKRLKEEIGRTAVSQETKQKVDFADSTKMNLEKAKVEQKTVELIKKRVEKRLEEKVKESRRREGARKKLSEQESEPEEEYEWDEPEEFTEEQEAELDEEGAEEEAIYSAQEKEEPEPDVEEQEKQEELEDEYFESTLW